MVAQGGVRRGLRKTLGSSKDMRLAPVLKDAWKRVWLARKPMLVPQRDLLSDPLRFSLFHGDLFCHGVTQSHSIYPAPVVKMSCLIALFKEVSVYLSRKHSQEPLIRSSF
jgi:hypothetical protein